MAQNKTEQVKAALERFLETSCAQNNEHQQETCGSSLMIHENPAATTGIELRCLSEVSDKEHLRTLLHGGASVIVDCYNSAFNVRARDKNDEGPLIEFKRPADIDARRQTA